MNQLFRIKDKECKIVLPPILEKKSKEFCEFGPRDAANILVEWMKHKKS